MVMGISLLQAADQVVYVVGLSNNEYHPRKLNTTAYAPQTTTTTLTPTYQFPIILHRQNTTCVTSVRSQRTGQLF